MIPRNTVTIEEYEHGIGVRGSLPVGLFVALTKAVEKERGYDRLATGVASAMGLLFFITDEKGHKAAEAEIAFGLVGLAPLDAWLAGTDTGISSRTIGQAITGRRGVLDSFGADIPYDPADFGRCHRLLERIPEFRPQLGKVAEEHPAWAPFVAAWDELTALFLEESPTGKCPKLYARMRELRGGE